MIDTVYKIVAFAITLGVLVVFHELGHYVIARLAGSRCCGSRSDSGGWCGRDGSDATRPSGHCRRSRSADT